MPELLHSLPGRALAVYAHPDDPDVSCGGTLARWVNGGSEVHVLVCTNGDKGTTDPDVRPRDLAETRAHEMIAAAEVLKLAGHHTLGHPDGEIDNDAELREQVVRFVRDLRPEAVLCPDPTAVLFGEDYLNHRDHRVTGFAVLDALSPAAALPNYFPDAGPVHQVQVAYLSGTLEPTVWVDITDTIGEKVASVMCHKTQVPDPDWAERVVRLRAEAEGQRVGVEYAEAFRRLRLHV
ncbi:MAG: PIG-L deacetylase family protein [Acidimicrobiales bacterium]